jgi:ABC-2 type transport system ATP-binding protein
MTNLTIAANGLRKSYGEKVVLDGIDLHVDERSVFALLGPNGAGKTTTVNILSTLIGADAGGVRILGHDLARDPDAIRAVIGLTGQFSALDEVFTGRENLQLMADLHHLDKAEGRRSVAELLERFGLVDAADAPVRTYSGGMRRRLDLAMTLVGRPRLIFTERGVGYRIPCTVSVIEPRRRAGNRRLWDEPGFISRFFYTAQCSFCFGVVQLPEQHGTALDAAGHEHHPL